MMGRNRGRTDEDMKGGWMNQICHPKYKSSRTQIILELGKTKIKPEKG